jgi:retron-type reverse transcriptase
MHVLVEAWHAIRRNAETSQTRSTKEKAKLFGQDLPKNLRRIQDRLRKGYNFQKAYGATPSKGPGKQGKRPLVVAPIEDRIVQRAILDVLQGAAELQEVQAVLATRTSIGGIPGRGVDCAIELIDQAWSEGYRFAAGSDIKGFFTKIPKPKVFEFLRNEIDDLEFLALVERALTVELCNAEQLSAEDLHLFPTGQDGVAQGCPLSALAGNIVLNAFDKEMNDPSRGLVCIRYIDDFLVLGKKLKSVEKGMDAAKAHLKRLCMDTYDPVRSPKKAFSGMLNGQVFLGHSLVPGSYPPSDAAQAKLRKSVNSLIQTGQKAIDKAVNGRKLKSSDRTFAATIVAITNSLQGWRGSFRSSNCPALFAELDRWVQRRVSDLERYLRTHTAGADAIARNMALGLMPLVAPLTAFPNSPKGKGSDSPPSKRML